jgi:hypothetical protein
MKWTSYLLGGLGQPLDSHHHEQELRLLRRSLTGERLVHRNQDANIEALWQENHELKVYLRALIHLLTSKRLVSGEEIGQMVRMIERSAEPDPRPPLNAPGSAADTSAELQDLSKAVSEVQHPDAGTGDSFR